MSFSGRKRILIIMLGKSDEDIAKEIIVFLEEAKKV